jgi:hypothetical protein
MGPLCSFRLAGLPDIPTNSNGSYGGKLMRIERQIHHYGSGLNALPMLDWFQHNPTDIYLLRVGYGGNSGPLSNIDQSGFASAPFHSWPDTLAWDAYSGDYGPNFSGLVMRAGTYVVTTDELGTVAFGGNVLMNTDGSVEIYPRDPVRRKVYLAQYGILVTIDAGSIDTLVLDSTTRQITVSIAESISAISSMAVADYTILRVEKVVQILGVEPITMATSGLSKEKGGWNIPLGSEVVNIELLF